MSLIINAINRFSSSIGRFCAWLTLAMVIITFAIVVLRYLFNLGWIAMQESVLYLHACVFMLGAAYTLQSDGHVRVDIFYSRFSARKKAWVNLFGTVFFLFPVCVFIIWISWEYVAASWSLYEGSREAGGLPGVFLIKSLIPATAIMLLLQGVASSFQQFSQSQES